MKVTVRMSTPDAIAKKRGLGKGGLANIAFANEFLKLCAKRTPMDTGALQSSGRIIENGAAVMWPGPYARAMYYGDMWVDPKTGAAGFLTKNGWRSRRGVKKVHSNRKFTYSGAPTRGAKWAERTAREEKTNLLQVAAKLAGGRPK